MTTVTASDKQRVGSNKKSGGGGGGGIQTDAE